METFQKQLHLPVTRIDDSKRMLALLKVSCNSLICILQKLRLVANVLVFAIVYQSNMACSVYVRKRLRAGSEQAQSSARSTAYNLSCII